MIVCSDKTACFTFLAVCLYFSAALLKTDLVWCKTHSDAEPIVFFSSVTAKSRSSASCWQSSHFLSWLYSKAFCNNNFPLGINKGNSDSDQSSEVLKITTKTLTLTTYYISSFPWEPTWTCSEALGGPQTCNWETLLSYSFCPVG